MTLDVASLERAIVRHASPTLAGMKPAALFNVPGTFAADATREPAAQLDEWLEAKALRTQLEASVDQLRATLRPCGVDLKVVAWRMCGALVYVFRPQDLARRLSAHPISRQLNSWGYETRRPGWLARAIDQLGQRLEQCHRKDPNAGFPHEVGFFLGYPFEDVMGFIEHEGRDYLCCGAWKVYANREAAEASFARYRRCTEAYEALLDMGARIADLALVRVGQAA